MKIKIKVLIILLSVSTIPILVVGLISIYNIKKSLHEEIGKQSLRLSDIVVHRLMDLLDNSNNTVRSLINTTIPFDIITNPNNEVRVEDFRNFSKSLSSFNYFGLADTAGNVIVSSLESLNHGFYSGPEMEIALSGKSTFRDIQFNPIINKFDFLIIYPVFDSATTNVVGVMIGSLKVEEIQKTVNSIKIRGTNQNIANHIHVMNQSGLIFSDYDTENCFTINLIEQGSNTAKLAMEGKKGNMIEMSDHEKLSFATYSSLEADSVYPGWLIVAQQDKEEIYTTIVLLERIILFSLVGIILLMIVISGWLASLFTKQIRSIAKSVKKFGKGNLLIRADISSKDEIGEMAAAFNTMAENISNSTTQLSNANEYVENIINSMRDLLVVVDLNFNVTTVNKAIIKTLKICKKDVIGKSVYSLFEKRSFENYDPAELLAGKAVPSRYETMISSKGIKVPVLLSPSYIYNYRKEIVYILFLGRDENEQMVGNLEK